MSRTWGKITKVGGGFVKGESRGKKGPFTARGERGLKRCQTLGGGSGGGRSRMKNHVEKRPEQSDKKRFGKSKTIPSYLNLTPEDQNAGKRGELVEMGSTVGKRSTKMDIIW